MTDPMKGVFRALDISTSGMRAEMQRQEVVAANLGNMHRTGNATKEPYRRRAVVFEEVLQEANGARGADQSGRIGAGTAVAKVVEDQTPFPVYYQPGDPNADESGQVWGSNVDLFQELVDMTQIERSFDANLQAMKTYRGMLQNTISNLSSK